MGTLVPNGLNKGKIFLASFLLDLSKCYTNLFNKKAPRNIH